MAGVTLDASQVAQALETSVCKLLAQRLRKVKGSAFEQALDLQADVARVEAWCERASAALAKATWAECKAECSEELARITAAARAAGVAGGVAEAASAAALEAARAEIIETMGYQLSTSSLRVKTLDGSMQDISTVWRTMQAAATNAAALDDVVATYTEALSMGGAVGVKTGDGAVVNVQDAVKLAARESARAAADDVNWATASSVGMDAVCISAHADCAPDHLPYQGKTYTLAEFEALNASLERPIGRGVMNCRHTKHYRYSGTDSLLTDDELSLLNSMSTESVSLTGLSGQTLTKTSYEATQYLKTVERRIRAAKESAIIKSAGGLSTAAEAATVERLNDYWKGLCEELGETAAESRITCYTVAAL